MSTDENPADPYAMPTYQPADGSPEFPAPPPAAGPIGSVRSTGLAIFLFLITLGIYGLYWYYVVHKEMKDHTDDGLGGPLALVLAFFVGIVMPYLTAHEVGEMYQRAGEEKPVNGLTGLWYFPGMLILVGPIVWFVKTNGALNDYWRARGAVG